MAAKRVEEMSVSELKLATVSAKWLYYILQGSGCLCTIVTMLCFLMHFYIIGIICLLTSAYVAVLLHSLSAMRKQIQDRLTKEFRGE